MSQLQFLNVFITERLTAVAMEISVVLEQNIGEYLEEISRSNEENKRLQSLLDLVFNSEIKLHREDSQQLSLPVSEEEVPHEQQHCEQERSPSQGQEDPEHTQIKEEQEEVRTSQEEDQPQGLEPDTKDILIPACVKSDYEQDPPLPSHLDQTLENRERDSLPTNTTEQIKTEPDGEDYSISEPTRDSQLLSEAQVGNIEERVDGMERPIPPPFSPDSQQPSLPVSKEEVPPEQQERSPRLGLEDPESTKQEELWTNQEEQQLESDSRVSEPTSDSQLLSAVNPDCSAAQSENRVSEPTSDSQLLSAVNPDCSAAQSENRVSEPTSDSQLLSAVNPDCSAAQSENRVSEPTSDSQLLSAVNPDCSAAQSENRVSEPTSDSQLLSAVNPDCSAAQSENRVSEPTSDSQLLSAVNPDCSAAQSENRVSEPTSDSQLLSAVNPDCSAAQSENRVSEPTSDSQLLSAVNPDCSAAQSENRVSEPTSDSQLLSAVNPDCSAAQSENRVSEPTSDSQLLSAVNPDCSAAQSENRVSEPTSDSQLLSAVNPDCSAAQSENRVSEPTSDSQLLSAVNPDCSAAQSENRVSEPTSDSQLLSAVNPDCSAAQSENRVSEPTSDSQLLSAVNPDCSAAQSENRVSEPTSDSQLLSAVNPDCSAAQSENRVSEPTSDSQLLSAVNPDCSAAQSENRVSEPTSDSQLLSAVNPDCSAAQSENVKVHQSPSTSSEQDSSNVESNEASSFSTWSEENISVTDSNSSDSSSCTKEDSETQRPAKRTCHSSGVVNEPSDLSNLCDENNPGTEISPSDGNKDMNIQTDSGAHNPAKRICRRVQSASPEVVCSRVTTPSAAPSSTHVIPMSVTDSRRSKKRCCRYCGKAYVKITRHMRIVHRDEAFSFRKKSRERKVLRLLNKKGGVVRNVAVARRGSGEMGSCSRPKVPGSTPCYTHCLHCQGLYIQKSLRKHVRYCPLNPKAEQPKPGPKMRIQSAMAFKMRPQPDYVSTGLWKIVCGMNSGRVSFVVRNDKCILLMGEELYNKLQPDDRRNKYLQQRMREVARLLITARTCTPLMCFEDLVIPSNLPHVITAVRAVAGYNEENKTYDRPTLAVQMGYNLMNIGNAVESCALTSGRHKVAESAGKFKGFKWNEVVLAGALTTLSEPQNKCPQPTPVTQAPGQPTCCTRTQPTPVTQAPGQPTCCTRTQPTPVAQAPGQPTRCTRTQPTRRTRTQPTRRTRTQPTRRTGTQPTRRTGTQPTRRTGTQPTRRTGTQPTRRTGTQATRSTGTQATRSTGTQATRSTGTQATRSTGTQPTQRNTVRLKRIVDEGAAVEKHIMAFIKSGQVPEKRDCLKCLQSEPVALKSRNWSGIKFYVNRVKQRRSAAGNSEGSTPDLDSNSGPETGNPTP
ncbi:uncharacterized protein LOC109884847 isoform X1 [Oncorhynchus kisutch]|uniref:uncharacterized protein LOC109884847 isoform X1 n=1 Tax=Oncorhynchus kisutch TaxID=8019 RepID=UPI0012DE5B25|nr:uncharacterized protein LOC109884847 isoform X1 [Oncorhynchus kisutch]